MKMPSWPEVPPIEVYVKDRASHLVAYQSLRADAWEARARLAVQALKDIAGIDIGIPLRENAPKAAKEALKAIGELPPA